MARLFWIAFLFLGVVATSYAAEPQFPALTGRIVDNANIIDASTERTITDKLTTLENQTGKQVVVVTLPSLQGYEIEDYGYQLGRHWGIGEKDKNTGALLIVAPNEHSVRIEVGYGLEGTLTDAISRLIIENAILPRFRTGDFSGGISSGVDQIVQILSDPKAAENARAAASNADRKQSGKFPWVGLLIFLWILFLFLRGGNRRSSLPWIVPMALGNRGRGWGGNDGSGFGSGGFGSGGGFSGGGGSFGGGGASGRW